MNEVDFVFAKADSLVEVPYCYASYFFYIRSAHRDLEDVKKY